jgi:pimeloyl-ACP methyl ester carboxylesterase
MIDAGPVAERVGIVIVHGVMPHPRYEIQDECAAALCAALANDPLWQGEGPWVADVVNPHAPRGTTSADPLPTIMRVHTGSSATSATRYFDIVEGYWSPLDKGMTNFAGVLTWLLQTVLVPANTAARYVAPIGKTIYDIAFIGLSIVLSLAFFAASFIFTIQSLNALIRTFGGASNVPSTTMRTIELLLQPAALVKIFTLGAIEALLAGAIGAILIAQAIKGFVTLGRQWSQLLQTPLQLIRRLAILTGLSIGGLALLRIPWHNMGTSAVLFVLAAVFFTGARRIAEKMVTQFFADIEIYTTRNENSQFFAAREAILALVTQTIVTTCTSKDSDGRGYDRIFVLGHSLGSTICLDALVRFYNLCQQEPALQPAFARIAGFVTFGSPLEKTKFFFDAVNPSPSAALDQWNNDAYGSLFTGDERALDGEAKGILWSNYWYFADAIANEIESYRSFVPAGASLASAHSLRASAGGDVPGGKARIGRLICRNERGHRGLRLPSVLPHGDYLTDPWFWHSAPAQNHLGVLDIVARRQGKAPCAPPKPARGVPATTSAGATYEELTIPAAVPFADRYQ